ncbi:MAG: hypothetical protein JSS67_01300 [Bacteroidetes bacterium]|nr:hypothetical protein [Bacteroidota bacterium]
MRKELHPNLSLGLSSLPFLLPQEKAGASQSDFKTAETITHTAFQRISGGGGGKHLLKSYEYINSRIDCLFRSILYKVSGKLMGIRKFIFCEDYRHSPDASGNCATAADHNCP